MKNLKKLASVALALVMTMALMVPAFAQTIDKGDSDGGSITVENAAVGAEYKFYKLFDATNKLDAEGNSISIAYTCTNKPAGLDAYFNYTEVTVNGETYFEVTPTAAAGTTGPDGVASAGLVQALTTWAEGATPLYTESPTANSGAFTLDNVPYGYYVVTSDVGNGSAISVDSTTPNANIKEKNIFEDPSFPANAKTADKDSANVGDTVTYTLRVNATNYYTTTNGANEKVQNKIYNYTIKDTMTPGVMSNPVVDSIAIYDLNKNGSVGNKIQDLTTQQFTNGEITINWTVDGTAATDHLYKNGVQIVVTYHATVLAAAEDGVVIHNELTADKNGSPIGDPENPPYKDVTVAKIVIDKYAGTTDGEGNVLAPTDDSVRLQGATFLLKNSAGAYYKYTAAAGDAPAKVEWVAKNENPTAVTTDEDGAAEFPGLANGIYFLEETAAPAGYNLMTSDFEITVAAQAGDANVATLTATAQVANLTGAELPSTGGMGTTIFYVVGGVLLVGSAILFVTKKRMGE